MPSKESMDSDMEMEERTTRKKRKRSFAPPPLSPTSSASLSSSSDVEPEMKFAESGIITQIRVDDFLCHHCLEVDLNPNCNFIVGKNGSGKSALMIALQVCLGARATDTQRGPSLKQFVRWGCDHAVVAVTLKNEGNDAYERTVYGSRIIVKRIIPRTSTARYQICNEDGNVISTKRSDLTPILDHLNIRVGNPCVVLSQDRSREFFQSCTNEKLYHFFLEATSLENMRQKIVESVEKQTQMSSLIEQKEECMPDIKSNYIKARDDFKAADTLLQLETKIPEMETAIAWAMVVEVEKKIESERKVKAKKEQKKSQLEMLLENEHKTCQELEDENTRCQTELKTVTEDERNLSSELRNINAEIKTKTRTFRIAENNVGSNKKNVAGYQRQISNAQQRIQKIETEASRDYDAERAQINKALEKMFQRLNTSKERLSDCKTETKECESPQSLDEQLSSLSRLEMEKNARLSEVKDRLKQIRKAKKDSLACFGVHTPAILKEIERQKHKFSVLPIGPVGRYIRLLQTDWATPVELCITPAVMCGYIVNDYSDQAVLKRILSNFKSRRGAPYVMVQKVSNRPYPVPKNPFATHGIHRVVDHVEIENLWAKNVVIDQTQIERYLLLERSGGEGDEGSAYEFLKRARRNRAVQDRFNGVWTKDGCKVVDRNGRSIGSTYHRHNQRFLNVDYENELKELAEKQVEIQNELKLHHRDRDRLTSQRQQIVNKQRALQHKIRATQTEISKQEDMINDLQSQLEIEKDSHDELIQEINTEIKQCEEQIAEKMKEQEALIAEEQHADATVKKLRQSRLEVVGKGEQLTGGSTEIQKRLEHVAKEHRKHKNRITNMITAKTQYETETKTRNDAIDALDGKLKERLDNAAQLSQERIILEGETVSTLSNSLVAIQARIDIERDRLCGDVAEIKKRMEEAEKKYMEVKDILDAASENLQAYQKACQVRNREWKRFRKTISEDATRQFTYYLQNQNHAGKIEFNHDDRTLEMEVKMSQHRSEKSTTDTKALSGGERSYTTLAFILALSESMNCPFRCIDEFDIYMDSVNRQISTKLLLSIANRRTNRQFIFLTPLDISMVKVRKNVQIVKLNPPKRGRNPAASSSSG